MQEQNQLMDHDYLGIEEKCVYLIYRLIYTKLGVEILVRNLCQIVVKIASHV